MKAVRLLVTGRVQGVGYRWYVLRTAERLGLSGWVKNLADRRVECFVQGPQEVVNVFISFLKEGPALSRVDDITAVDEPPVPGIITFSIK